MGSLCIIDVSAVVYTGVFSPRYSQLASYGYPTGGINFFISQLMIPFYENNDMLLCFDSPNFRTALQKDYKGGRNHNAAAISQIETLYEYLSECGFPCYKFAGYEADDIVDWAVSKYWRDYESVIIVGNDIDLCYSLRPNVVFRACRSDMNCIRRSNFEYAVVRGEEIPYNMINAYKCFCGCKSDNIPAFRKEDGEGGKALFTRCADDYMRLGLCNDYDRSSSASILRTWARTNGGFSPEDLEKFDVRIQLIYPAEPPEDLQLSVANRFAIDIEKLSTFLTMFGVRDAMSAGGGGSVLHWVQLTDDQKKQMYQLSDQFKSGSFNADKNIPIDSDRVASSVLRIDAFEKDFR